MMADFYYSARDILDEAMGTDAYFQIKSILTGMKAADVVEVRHGRWSSNGTALVCSECGRAFGIVEMFAHYCPWCGARMDKEDEHETAKND